MKIKSEHAVEKLEQLLLKMVQDGEIQAGQRLPSQAELARRFGVCRNTVSAAVGRLACRGIVVTRVGVGTEAVELLRSVDLKLLLEIARRRADRAPALQVLDQVVRVLRCVLVQACVDAADQGSEAYARHLAEAASQVAARRGNPRSARRAEYQFWRVVAGASGNVAVTAALNSTRPLWAEEWPPDAGMTPSDPELLATVATAVRLRRPQHAAIAANLALRHLSPTWQVDPFQRRDEAPVDSGVSELGGACDNSPSPDA